jgi:hypothetical protein
LKRFAVGLLGPRAPVLVAIFDEIPVGGAGKPDLAKLRGMLARRAPA